MALQAELLFPCDAEPRGFGDGHLRVSTGVGEAGRTHGAHLLWLCRTVWTVRPDACYGLLLQATGNRKWKLHLNTSVDTSDIQRDTGKCKIKEGRHTKASSWYNYRNLYGMKPLEKLQKQNTTTDRRPEMITDSICASILNQLHK